LQRSGTNSDTNTAVRIKGLWNVTDATSSIVPAMLYQRYAAGDTSTFIPAVGNYDQFNQVHGQRSRCIDRAQPDRQGGAWDLPTSRASRATSAAA
jgi:hypothetical protein